MRILAKQENCILKIVRSHSFQRLRIVLSIASSRAVLSIAMIFIFVTTLAHIKNGHETQATIALQKLDSINKSLEKSELTPLVKRELKSKARKLQSILEYYQTTGYLLELFKSISPELYSSIDSIKDATGKSIDVYVKFYPERLMKHGVVGLTSYSTPNDVRDTPYSSYGINTVSVIIYSLKNWSLIFLAHELGHIAYQIPNLKTYNKIYSNLYKNPGSTDREIGHHPDDESGQLAFAYQKSFRNMYKAYADMPSRAYANKQSKKILTVASR